MVALPEYWEHAKVELSSADPVMGRIIASYAGEGLTSRGDAFYTLCRSIVGQQVSVKSADSMWNKVVALCERHDLSEPDPAFIKRIAEEDWRNCGLSRQKITYLNEIADYFIARKVNNNYFHKLSDAEVLSELTSIKGIGKWTAEMFMIFHLLRPDVFPVDDIGLQRAIEMHYLDGEKIDKKQMINSYSGWAPWRTVATWYLWRSLDPVPVEY